MGNGPFQSFVNVSIGGCRKIEFFTNYQKATETPAKTVRVQNGSMYTMNTGCQKYFRHRVPTTGSGTEARFNLSFRCILDINDVPIRSPSNSVSGSETWETPVKAPLKAEATTPIYFSPRTLPPIPRASLNGTPKTFTPQNALLQMPLQQPLVLPQT